MKPGKRLISLIFFVAAALLLGSVIFTYRIGLMAIQASRKMAAERLVLQHLEEYVSTVKDAETGERGYLLTGQEPYLQPYEQALSRLQMKLDYLRQASAAGELSADTVERVIALTYEKLDELDGTIQLRREHSLTEAQVVSLTGRGREIMDHIRAGVGELQAEEQAEFDQAARRTDRAIFLRTGTVASVCVLNFAFLVWAFRKVAREMARREVAVAESNRQKELLATTLASIGDGVIVTDAEGRLTFLNGEAERLTGWKNIETKGEALSRVFRVVYESTRKPAESPVEKVLQTGAVVGTDFTVLLSKDGREIPIDDSAAPIRHAGALAGVVLVFRDVTDQKKAREVLARSKDDLERLVEERTVKLREMVDELQHVSYSITHDMRAPLRAMSAFAGILLERSSADESSGEVRDYSRRILVAASRLDKLIQDALHYTKTVLQDLPLEPVDLSRLVRGLVETYPNLQPENGDIRIENKLPVVLGNEALLTQCFSNLLGNAVKFVAGGTRPVVHVQSEEPKEGMTRIWITDNGIGISKPAQARLFGMFQRLTNDYEGSGIGLAIVRKVVQKMGGRVGAESEPGKGSRFWLELRLATGVEDELLDGVKTPEAIARV